MEQFLISVKKTYDIPLDKLQELIRSGKAAEQLHIHDILMLEFDGVKTPFEVAGIDKANLLNKELEHSVTIQMVSLTGEERPFDVEGSNKWETSSLRAYMNGEEFLKRFEAGADQYIETVAVENDDNYTNDKFFILSKAEIKELHPTEAERTKNTPAGETDWYWTRSANRGSGYNAWCVGASGYVNIGYGASNAIRFAPACVLA